MMRKKRKKEVSQMSKISQGVLCALLFISACNTLKYIPEEEHLYTRTRISLKGDLFEDGKQEAQEAIEEVIQPKPNSKFLGIRLGLWAHYRVKTDKASFYAKWINKKWGEEPVFVSDVDLERTNKLIINRLENNGFFGSYVDSETRRGRKTGLASYQIFLSDPYTVATYQFRGDTTSRVGKHLQEAIQNEQEIGPGSRFDLDDMKSERKRLETYLKDLGFYNFNAEYLLFTADSTGIEGRKLDLYLSLKQNTPSEASVPYDLKKITVYPNYALNASKQKQDTTEVEDITFIQSDSLFDPEKLQPYILMKEGERYSQENERFTYNRISNLNTYRFINIRFQKIDSLESDSIGYMNTTINLSPLNKRSLSAELQGVSKSNNFIGPALVLNYRNRNLFRGGESFNLKTKFGYEAQIIGEEFTGLNSYEIGVGAELVIPRLISPLDLQERFRYSIPRTKIGLSYDLMNRVQYYKLNSFLATFGYDWTVNPYVSHTLNPISINFVNVTNRTEAFRAILEENPFFARSFEQQFIAGLTYSYQYNKINLQDQKSRLFVHFGIDMAGNLINAYQSLTSKDEEGRFLGEAYAQYSRFDLDFRHYYRLDDDEQIIARIYGGIGFPYGNSEALPYSKQFFSGGPNSVRAFRIRALGPGPYVQPESEEGSQVSYFEQAGDIKIEANLEYRFPLVSYLKGALFVDAGNVWLQNDNEALGGGAFSKNWINEMGVGAGFGLRLDIEFFVIRLDVATPLRKPLSTETGFEWQNEFRLGSKSWRKDNIIWNFAIGYPF